MKEKRIEKEIKKAQKKGIYNPKLKLGIVGLILVIGTVIGVSYAYYTDKSTTVLTISGTVSKKIKVTVTSSGNGTVSSSPKTVDYGTQATFTVQPNEGYQYKAVTCKEDGGAQGDVTETDEANYTESTNTLTVTPKTSQNVTCTVEFERVRTLKEIAEEIKGKAKSTSPNSTDFYNGCPTSTNDSCSGVYSMTDYQYTSSSLNYGSPGGISYYFRGEADNYVKFGRGTTLENTTLQDLIWRIVRINGDGSIRLVLDSDIGTSEFNTMFNAGKYVGYTYGNKEPCTNASPCTSEYSNGQFSSNNTGTSSIIKSKLEEWYIDNLKAYNNYITYGTYCNDTSFGSGSETGTLYYGAYERLQNGSQVAPQLTCPDPTTNYSISTPSESSEHTGTGYRTYGGVYKLKIGLLSADEIVLAGFKPTTRSPYVTKSNYLYYTGSSDGYFWSSSPFFSDTSLAYGFYGGLGSRSLYSDSVDDLNGARPVINLKTEGLNATGEGTKESPFIIK